MLEVATIVFLGLGLGHKTVSASTQPKPVTAPTVSEVETTVADPVIAALMRAKRPVTNDELAAILGVTKGTASRKVAALNGVIRGSCRSRSSDQLGTSPELTFTHPVTSRFASFFVAKTVTYPPKRCETVAREGVEAQSSVPFADLDVCTHTRAARTFHCAVARVITGSDC
jgi:hypothetical protein